MVYTSWKTLLFYQLLRKRGKKSWGYDLATICYSTLIREKVMTLGILNYPFYHTRTQSDTYKHEQKERLFCVQPWVISVWP